MSLAKIKLEVASPQKMRPALVCLFAFCGAVILAEFYRWCHQLHDAPMWAVALAVNSCFVLGISLFPKPFSPPKTHHKTRFIYFLTPSLVVVVGASILAFGTRYFLPDGKAISAEITDGWTQCCFVLIVPFVEEIFFRKGVGGLLRPQLGVSMGGYISALVFALMHGNPTLERLLAGAIGFPLGPFLLGISCEWLYAASGRLLPGIVLHMVCNSTVLLFSAIDSRWLEWLRALYI